MKKLITCLVVCVLSSVVAAEIHHVPADFPTIQYAIDAALDGDEIIVAPGTYTSTADEVVDMRGKEIWLHSSNGAEVTIIDGEGVRRGVYCYNGETINTIIEGFTFTNNTAQNGGAIYTRSSDPVFAACTFTNNTAEYGGVMYNRDGSPTFSNCTFNSNTANDGGGVYNFFYNTYMTPSFTNCTFTNNTANRGGAIFNDGGELALTDCVFSSNNANLGGGGLCNYSGSPTLTDCEFIGNVSGIDGGGMLNTDSSPTVTNCIFTSNTANDSGGGISCYAATITGCAFIQNTATNGGGIFSSGSDENDSPTISNSNFCENNPDAIYGNWNNSSGNEFLNTCGDIEGACCVKEACYEVELIFCESIDGEWLGYNATCEEDSCVEPPQYGACCINGEAIPLYDYDCNRILGIFMGEGTNPDDVSCPLVCAEDVNGDGLINVSDLLAIISVWGACP